MTTKSCNKCLQDKPLEAFYADRNRADGRTTQCRECKRAYEALRAKDPEYRKRRNTRKRKHQASAAGKLYHKNYKYKSRYGISVSDYEALVAEQSGKCAICRTKAPLVIDHCHEKSVIRDYCAEPATVV